MSITKKAAAKAAAYIKKQMAGIEPVSPAWEASVLPMNYICITCGTNDILA